MERQKGSSRYKLKDRPQSMQRSPNGNAEPSLERNRRRASESVQGAVSGGSHPEGTRLLSRIARQFRQQFEDVGENGHDLSNKNNRASPLLSLRNLAGLSIQPL